MNTRFIKKIATTLNVFALLFGTILVGNCSVPPGMHIYVYNSSGQAIDRTVDGDVNQGQVGICNVFLGFIDGTLIRNSYNAIVGYVTNPQ